MTADEFRNCLKDEKIKNIKTPIGAVHQFSDSTDLLTNIKLLNKLKKLY